jgi:hypothetical protein
MKCRNSGKSEERRRSRKLEQSAGTHKKGIPKERAEGGDGSSRSSQNRWTRRRKGEDSGRSSKVQEGKAEERQENESRNKLACRNRHRDIFDCQSENKRNDQSRNSLKRKGDRETKHERCIEVHKRDIEMI